MGAGCQVIVLFSPYFVHHGSSLSGASCPTSWTIFRILSFLGVQIGTRVFFLERGKPYVGTVTEIETIEVCPFVSYGVGRPFVSYSILMSITCPCPRGLTMSFSISTRSLLSLSNFRASAFFSIVCFWSIPLTSA